MFVALIAYHHLFHNRLLDRIHREAREASPKENQIKWFLGCGAIVFYVATGMVIARASVLNILYDVNVIPQWSLTVSDYIIMGSLVLGFAVMTITGAVSYWSSSTS